MDELSELKSLVRDLGLKISDRMDQLEVEIESIREEAQFGRGFAQRVQSDMEEILAGRRPKPLPRVKRIKRRTSDDWALVALYGLLGERLGVS